MTNPRKYPTGTGDNHPDYNDWNNMVDFASALNDLGLDWTTIYAYLTGLTASGYIRAPYSYYFRESGGFYDATTGYGQLAFGGSGDEGGVDGTSAEDVLQACIDAIYAANGGILCLAPGTYTADLTQKSHVNIYGAGRQVTAINGKFDYTSAQVFTVANLGLYGTVTEKTPLYSSGDPVVGTAFNHFANFVNLRLRAYDSAGYSWWAHGGDSVTFKDTYFIGTAWVEDYALAVNMNRCYYNPEDTEATYNLILGSATSGNIFVAINQPTCNIGDTTIAGFFLKHGISATIKNGYFEADFDAAAAGRSILIGGGGIGFSTVNIEGNHFAGAGQQDYAIEIAHYTGTRQKFDGNAYNSFNQKYVYINDGNNYETCATFLSDAPLSQIHNPNNVGLLILPDATDGWNPIMIPHVTHPSTAGWGATEKGRTWFCITHNAIEYWDGSALKTITAT